MFAPECLTRQINLLPARHNPGGGIMNEIGGTLRVGSSRATRHHFDRLPQASLCSIHRGEESVGCKIKWSSRACLRRDNPIHVWSLIS